MTSMPSIAASLFNTGLAALQTGDLPTARAAFDRVVQIAPDAAAAHHLRGIVLQNQGRLTEADAAITRAIALDAREPDFLANRALVRSGLKQFAAAIADAQAAIALKPHHRGALANLGLARIATTDYAGAVAALRQLTACHPRFAPGYGNLGIALDGLGQPAEARAAFEAGLALAPDNLELLRGLGDALGKLGDMRAAAGSYRRALELQPAHAPTRSSYLATLNYLDDLAPAEKAEIARDYGRRLEQAIPALPAAATSREDRPLRIGFISGDLRTHSVSFFLTTVLPALGQLGDQLFAYATHPAEDATSDALRPSFTAWRNITGLGDTDAAARIRADAIDILIDLSGYSSAHRLPLLAQKPAPLAMTWLGYPATTGLTRIDYVIADRRVLPPELEPLFTERPLRLADSFLCFAPHQFAPPPHRTDGPVTFGSFNKTTKLSAGCVATWARILHRVPGSRLLLKDRRIADAATRLTLAERFAAHGIPAERLALLARTPSRDEHFALYGEMTMALDPFPYAGTTTTMEALTAGVPVLTLEAGGLATRVGASLLATAGLDDWIATDLDDYVERAVALVHTARDPRFRASLRGRVLASPLCDAPRFARGLHAALHAAWRGAASFMPASD